MIPEEGVPTDYRENGEFQLEVAEEWKSRGDSIQDPFAKFFFYFAGFNALYVLWSWIGNTKRNETDKIRNLIDKLGENRADDIIKEVRKEIQYFLNRDPIENMRNRQKSGRGHPRQSLQEQLKRDVKEKRLFALGEYLYQIRCNLVHGSKMTRGDDREVIENALGPLRKTLDASISVTREELSSS